MAEQQDVGQRAPADPPPATQKGDNGVPKPKTYTEEEVEARFRGQGKKLSELEAELAKYRQADEERKQSERTVGERLLAEQERGKQLEAEVKSLREREETRLATLTKANEKRLEALPKELRPPVAGLDPDRVADILAHMESVASTKTVDIHGGAGRGAPADPERDHAERLAKAGHAFVFGSKEKK